MERFIPEAKLSKKARRALNAARRKTWGDLNPVTRKTKNLKQYDRKRMQKGDFPESIRFLVAFPAPAC